MVPAFGQGIRLVDKQESAAGLGENLTHLIRGMSDIPRHQVRPAHFQGFGAAKKADLMKDARRNPRHRGFRRTRIPGKLHVQDNRLRVLSRIFHILFHARERRNLAHLFLDVFKAGQRVQHAGVIHFFFFQHSDAAQFPLEFLPHFRTDAGHFAVVVRLRFEHSPYGHQPVPPQGSVRAVRKIQHVQTVILLHGLLLIFVRIKVKIRVKVVKGIRL